MRYRVKVCGMTRSSDIMRCYVNRITPPPPPPLRKVPAPSDDPAPTPRPQLLYPPCLVTETRHCACQPCMRRDGLGGEGPGPFLDTLWGGGSRTSLSANLPEKGVQLKPVEGPDPKGGDGGTPPSCSSKAWHFPTLPLPPSHPSSNS